MNIPASLKGLTAFVKRAEELDREVTNPDSKVVAYFCRTFAVERGIKLKAEGPEVNQFLFALMTMLENEKSCVQGISQEDRRLICERFAYAIFSKADEEDRSGNADKNTAKTFYAAATFLEILEQFGELDSDVSKSVHLCCHWFLDRYCGRYKRRSAIRNLRLQTSSPLLKME